MGVADFFLGLFSNDIGMDLGTANTLVYVKGRGVILREPSVVAVGRDGAASAVLAVGHEARRMLGRTPANIEAVRPLKDGVIADFEAAEKMIRYFIQKVHNRRGLLHPRLVIAVPSGITGVDRRAVQEAAEQAGAREVYLIAEALAAAIGAELPIHEPAGSMIVDIGAGTTEIAVISLSQLVVSQTLPVAGNEMDLAIQNYMRKKHGMNISDIAAENVKVAIGSVFPTEDVQATCEVRGLDLNQGLPRAISVTAEEIRAALGEPARRIVEAIRDVLSRTPPELASDLVERGIVMAGGTSLLRGMPELVSHETRLPVHRAPDPLSCVALGAGHYLESLEQFRRIRRSLV